MTNPNTDNLCNNMSMFGFNDDSRFSDCVLIIEIETHPKLVYLQYPAGAGRSTEQYFRIIKLHVNSVVLAEKSPFFHNLFMNATMESGQRCATLSIHASEENALMELLSCMHSGTLTTTAERALLDVLKLADKFRVVSCMKLCADLLINTPVNTMSAVVYLSLDMADEVQDLVEAGKQFVATQPTEIEDHWLPVGNLTSDFVGLCSEDAVFDLACEWVKARYPNVEDQRRIFSTHLGPHIRFSYMTTGVLKNEVLGCDVIDDEFAHRAVVDALYSKITTPFHHYDSDKTKSGSAYRPYGRRVSCDPVVKVVEFEFPCQEIAVYFDVRAPARSELTEGFKWAARWFRIYLCTSLRKGHFAVSLDDEEAEAGEASSSNFEYEFAARCKCTKQFVSKSSGLLRLPRNDGAANIVYQTPLPDFEAGKSMALCTLSSNLEESRNAAKATTLLCISSSLILCFRFRLAAGCFF